MVCVPGARCGRGVALTSSALDHWRTTASAKLDELETVHSSFSGAGPGRKWGTSQLNRALFLALSAQFQGFCRDLHDAAVDVHVSHATPAQAPVLQTLLTRGRKLDTGNPRPSALGADFSRLGFAFIPALNSASPSAADQLRRLERLMDFRNAVVHGNEAAIGAFARHALPIKPTKKSYTEHRKTLDSLAGTMDDVVAANLSSLLGTSLPW